MNTQSPEDVIFEVKSSNRPKRFAIIVFP